VNRSARVWWGDRVVGHLAEDDHGLLQFAYAADWLSGAAFPISISLPLSNGTAPVDAHAFFAGLLPEGRARQRISRQQQIAIDDDVGLLLALGEDCAGALTVLPAHRTPARKSNPLRYFSDAALHELIESQGSGLAGITGAPERFSLAGAQDKITVTLGKQGYALPDASRPSSHILKFETIKRVCFAEFMANQMAAAIGLPVVETEYRAEYAGTATAPWLQITRYDRARLNDRLVRLHQEDVLQALGIPDSMKYQKDGGPSLREIAEVLRAHVAAPARDLAHLRDWQIFNYLTGNWDGHPKNLALLFEPGSATPTLAPFYDLVAIEFLNLVVPGSYARDMALYVGASALPERIRRGDWEDMARDLGMPSRPLLARLAVLAEALPGVARACREAFAEAHGDLPIYDRFEESVRRRCKSARAMVLRK
jgi:serine/threonine-protein kinase HipA